MHDHYASSLGWSAQMVKTRIFDKASFELRRVAFDTDSIMQYWIPSSLTIDGSSIQPMLQLSEGDRDLIQDAYPISQSIEMGTVKINHAGKDIAKNRSVLVEAQVAPVLGPQKIAIGLNLLDMLAPDLRVRTSVEPLNQHAFRVKMHT
jgi:hypothetical protein